MSISDKTSFAPSTYQDRGLTVPFTTPGLTLARMRVAGNKPPEFLLAGWSGGKGYYVMTWKSIQDTMNTTLHDRVLYEQLHKQRVDHPRELRATILKVAARGLAGPESRDRARKLLRTDRDYRYLTSYQIILRLLDACHVPSHLLAGQDITTEAGQKLVKGLLAGAAKKVGISYDELQTRIDRLSDLVWPLGLPNAPGQGRLRELLASVKEVRTTLASWTDQLPPEVAPMCRFDAYLAEETLKLAGGLIERLDDQLAAMLGVMAYWDTTHPEMSKGMSRLWWLLDGWDYLVGLIKTSAIRSTHDRQATVARVFELVPMIPKEEYAVDFHDASIGSLVATQKRRIRPNEDWRTATLDFDQVRQIEEIRALMS